MHLGHDWHLFDLVRSPDALRLPQVLTRAEVARLFGAIREPRFLMVLRLIHACGLRLAVAAAQLPKGTCVPTLRHSYATHLLDAGVSIRLISAYLGHASLDTTLIYTHLTAVNEAGARAVLEQLRPPTNPAT